MGSNLPCTTQVSVVPKRYKNYDFFPFPHTLFLGKDQDGDFIWIPKLLDELSLNNILNHLRSVGQNSPVLQSILCPLLSLGNFI